MELTEIQKEKIIARIKDHIIKEKNGYCRVGWAIEEVMGRNFKPKNEKVLKKHLTGLTIKSNKFIKERSEKAYFDYDISLNPSYSWATAHPLLFSTITAVVSVALSLITVHLF